LWAEDSEIEDMQNKMKEIEAGIQQKKQEIKKLGKEEQAQYRQLRKLDKELKELRNDSYKIESKLDALERNIEYGERTLEMIREQMGSKNDQMNSKILIWYKYGNKDKLEYILSGDSYFDVLDRQERLKKILSYDKSSIQNIANVKKTIETEKEKIQSNKLEVEELKKSLSKKRRQVSSKKRERNKLIRKLANKKVYYQHEVDNLSKEKKEIERKIEEIILAKTKQVDDVSLNEIFEKIDYMIYPIEGKIIVDFGQKKVGNLKNTGIELKGNLGQRVKAVAPGKVIYSGKFQNLGKVIMLDHGYNLVSVYGNLISTYVKVGDIVDIEDKIGILGLSTNEKESRLYFEIRSKAKPVNPKIYLKK
jgi:septal ring factor EnvC (AmiA/AmiB activator)